MAQRETEGAVSTKSHSRGKDKSKGKRHTESKSPEETDGLKTVEVPECAVCLQTCVQPVQLPCDHIFCFLCVKGVANQSKRCALCRTEIPMEFLNHPNLVNTGEDICVPEEPSGGKEDYLWFYEGRNGWWQYDQRTIIELEDAYKQKQRCVELLIAGFLYVIDFENLIQIRRNDPTRRRRIKRDLATVPKKGVAGIKYFTQSVQQDDRQGDGDEAENTNSTTAVGGKGAPAATDSDSVVNTTAQLDALTLSSPTDELDGDEEAEPTDEVQVVSSSAGQSSGDHVRQTSHRRSPNSLVTMSTQVIQSDAVMPQGVRLRRGVRRQGRTLDTTMSRQEYLSTEPEIE
ncbi:uncharacterized protein LOC144445660 [Glandiceps talaboti]